GVGGLELLQLVEEAVEVAVGDLGAGLDVVEVVMMVDLAAQVLDLLRDVAHGAPLPWSAECGARSARGRCLRAPRSALRAQRLWPRPRVFASAVGGGRPAPCSPGPARP